MIKQQHILALALTALASLPAPAQTLWQEPPAVAISNRVLGPGCKDLALHPPFEFLKEKMGGTNPKIDVRDAAKRTGTVKLGSEVHSDTFSARLVHVLGYAAEPTYYVAEGSIAGARGLKRAKHFIAKDGAFRNARFKLHYHEAGADAGSATWSWVDNPFVGSHEFNGLKIVMMLSSNWDATDSRGGEGESNNRTMPDSWYAVTDWGASFGKTGGYFGRTRWDWIAYRAQTPSFVSAAPDGRLIWTFKGKHAEDITGGVRLEDVRWLMLYLSRVTDEGIAAGMIASGAPDLVAREFSACIRARIEQLQQVVDSATVRQATR